MTTPRDESGRKPSGGARGPAVTAAVDLGPDLPMPLFTSTGAWDPERVGVLAVCCSDGRWGEAFDEFCRRRLQVPRCDRWTVPGGPAWLAPGGACHDVSGPVLEQLDFLVRAHRLGRIVLLTHYGCGFYGERLQRGPRDCLSAQAQDARLAAGQLRQRFGDIQVEAYLAMCVRNCITFHALDE